MAARSFWLSVALMFSLACAGLEASAQQAQQAGPPAIDDRALDILRRMCDTIAQAKTVSFRSSSMVPIKGPGGIWINLYGNSRVVMQGQDKLFAETRGDFAPLDFYFDGKAITVYAPDKNLYAEKPAPATIDAMIKAAYKEDGKSFPYADLLVSEPFAKMTEGLHGAVYVGQSDIGAVRTNHLAFSNGGVEWQIWIGVDNNLPVLVVATYLDDASEPSYTAEFKDWKLNEPVDGATFTFQNATKAAKVEFRKPKNFNRGISAAPAKN